MGNYADKMDKLMVGGDVLRMESHVDDAVLGAIDCVRCGACCKAFTLPVSPEELRLNYEAAQRGDRSYDVRGPDGFVRRRGVDAMQAVWYPQLTSLSWEEVEKLGVMVEDRSGFSEGLFENSFWYSCGHLESRRLLPGESGYVKGGENLLYGCGIHENRPNTCVGFKPEFMGGYLGSAENVTYRDCSYRTEKWVQKFDVVSEDKTLSPGLSSAGVLDSLVEEVSGIWSDSGFVGEAEEEPKKPKKNWREVIVVD